MISLWNFQLFNHLPTRLVVIGRPVHRSTSTVSSRLGYKVYMHLHIMPETATSLCQLTSMMVSHLLLLPWHTAITGYRISSNNSNSWQQPATSHRQQANHYHWGVSWPTRVKTTTNRIYVWQFNCTKGSVSLCVMWNFPPSIGCLWAELGSLLFKSNITYYLLLHCNVISYSYILLFL